MVRPSALAVFMLDQQLELGWLLDREVARLGAPEDLVVSILLDPVVGAVVREAEVLVQHFLGEER